MYRMILLFLFASMLGSPLYAPCKDSPGEKLKGSITFDKRLALTVREVDKKEKPEERIFEATFKNVSAHTLRFYFEGCGICFWSVSANHDAFFPMDCAMHETPCLYRNLIELEPGQRAVKIVTWDAYPRCNTKKAYKDPIKSIRIRYLLKREGITQPAVYLESNELVFK